MDDLRYRLDDFELYKMARGFRHKVYQLIRQLPPTQRYCLDPQMRREVVSITNNIAEGHGRWHYQENIQYCRTARGSTEEIIDDLNLCIDECYGDHHIVDELKAEAYCLVSRINGYIVYLRKAQDSGRK